MWQWSGGCILVRVENCSYLERKVISSTVQTVVLANVLMQQMLFLMPVITKIFSLFGYNIFNYNTFSFALLDFLRQNYKLNFPFLRDLD